MGWVGFVICLFGLGLVRVGLFGQDSLRLGRFGSGLFVLVGVRVGVGLFVCLDLFWEKEEGRVLQHC